VREWSLAAGLAAIVMVTAAAVPALRVVDGDTLVLDGKRIRLAGIDAPEKAQMCGNVACGQRATMALSALVSRGKVTCDGKETDRYGRLIATCTVGGKDINAAMVAQGWAAAYRQYSTAYVTEEQAARSRKLGIWAEADPVMPWDYRHDRAAATATPAATTPVRSPAREPASAAPKGCTIKGNISSSGKIYHLPGSTGYDKTRIDTGKGERWFCTEAEARAAGWRAPRG